MDNVQVVLPRDRISNVPGNVAETILMCLPTRDAVRTSILSRQWRHVWTKLPQFVLDKPFWNNVDMQHSARVTLTRIIYQLLLRHDGPINKFTLSYPELSSCQEIDNLILFLMKNHLEDFTLLMWKDKYMLPSSFFSCQKLKRLRLCNCSIRSSPVCLGFYRLTTLSLTYVIISAETLVSLISGSPLLSELELKFTSGIDICIDAPNLKTFIFSGYTKSINFKRVPLLASVSIHQDLSKGTVDFVGVGCDTVQFFQRFLVLNSLELSHHILQGFVDISQKKLPASLIYLNVLKLSKISFNVMVDLSFTFCVLRSSPNLKFISIKFEDHPSLYSENATSYFEREDFSDICLAELREVKLNVVTGTKQELEFIRLLLAKSSSLEKFHIKPKQTDGDNGLVGYNLLKEVVKFRRLSKMAEIIFTE